MIVFWFLLLIISNGFSEDADITEVEIEVSSSDPFIDCIHKTNKFEKKPEVTKTTLQPIASNDLPFTNVEGDLKALENAFEKQLQTCKAKNQDEETSFGSAKVKLKKWCTETNELMLATIKSPEVKNFKDFVGKVKTQFNFYKLSNEGSSNNTLFTGYNSPLIKGSRNKSNVYKYPIYGVPNDLVQIENNGKKLTRKKNPDGSLSAYLTRAEIESNPKNKIPAPIIAYVADPVDLYYLHIEGAGKISLVDGIDKGKQIFVNYAANNGQNYMSLGKYMSCKGVEAKYLSKTGMKDFFKQNPHMQNVYLNSNPSYVFFKEQQNGPFAANGNVLTPGHSLAVDKSVVPYGSVVLFDAQKPHLKSPVKLSPFTSVAIAQDTGAAIKGNRVDIYWGDNEYAEFAASHMKSTGNLFIALPK